MHFGLCRATKDSSGAAVKFGENEGRIRRSPGHNRLTNAALGGSIPPMQTQQVCVCDVFERCHVNHKAPSREQDFIHLDILFFY